MATKTKTAEVTDQEAKPKKTTTAKAVKEESAPEKKTSKIVKEDTTTEKKPKSSKTATAKAVSHEMIRQRAYEIYTSTGNANPHENWHQAEQELLATLN